ncbi:hypothetical protein MB901379_01536 [Mycobacterium basiliense]|uniref:Uncharacterized protein n=1 Tax=Mycobacterium basiliense TaxID=2094119 RepID=A0A3S4BE60_9MYCO|nr:hypothetical protein MB901379_01536 [Mycobacterium basiliense]
MPVLLAFLLADDHTGPRTHCQTRRMIRQAHFFLAVVQLTSPEMRTILPTGVRKER